MPKVGKMKEKGIRRYPDAIFHTKRRLKKKLLLCENIHANTMPSAENLPFNKKTAVKHK